MGENRVGNGFLERFGSFLKEISQVDWKRFLSDDYKLYNIKQYRVQKLSPIRATELYTNLVTKFYTEGKQSETWHENQLRLFVWCMIAYSHLRKKSLSEFTGDDWKYLADLFCGKKASLCQFQFLGLRKTTSKSELWSSEQDKLLIDVISSKSQKNKWNDIAKNVFFLSHKKYFRSAKQCRERWNNYLDPQKTREAWSVAEDRILVGCAKKQGKKWAFIAKSLEGRRTEHMVKNRYKSIVTKFKKIFKSRKLVSQKDLLNAIYIHLLQVQDAVDTASAEDQDNVLDSSKEIDVRSKTQPQPQIIDGILTAQAQAEAGSLLQPCSSALLEERFETQFRRTFSENDLLEFDVELMQEHSALF